MLTDKIIDIIVYDLQEIIGYVYSIQQSASANDTYVLRKLGDNLHKAMKEFLKEV